MDALRAELARAGVRSRLLADTRCPQLRTLCLDIPSAKVETVLAMGERLAHALNVGHCRVERDGSTVVVQIPVPMRPMRPVPPGEGMSVPLGRDVRGRPVWLDLSSDLTPHALICGTTGSGKSETLRTIVAGIARQTDAQLVLIDGKGETFTDFPLPVVTDPHEAAGLLAWAVDQMQRRAAGWDSRLVIVVDELRYVLGGRGLEHLERLTALGRSRGVHVLCATQYASSDVLGRIVKANLPARIVLAVDDAQASTLALGIRGQDAHRLLGRGDALLRAGQRVTRLQVALAGDLGRLPQAVTPSRLGWPGVAVSAPVSHPSQAHWSQAPNPAGQDAVAWIAENAVRVDGQWRLPGVGRIAARFGAGKDAAARWQREASVRLSGRPETVADVAMLARIEA